MHYKSNALLQSLQISGGGESCSSVG